MDDTHTTFMKIIQFSILPPPPPVHLHPNFFHPLDLERPTSNEPPLNKQPHVTFKLITRSVVFDLAHKQCSGIIEGWLDVRVKRKIACQ